MINDYLFMYLVRTMAFLLLSTNNIAEISNAAKNFEDLPVFYSEVPISECFQELRSNIIDVRYSNYSSAFLDKETSVFYDELRADDVFFKEDEFISQFLDFLNAERAQNNTHALKWDTNLAIFAAYRVQQVEQHFSHYLPDGTSGISLYTRANGECLLSGPQKPSASYALQIFDSSPAHKRCQLNPDYTRAGFAYNYDDSGTFFMVCIYGW